VPRIVVGVHALEARDEPRLALLRLDATLTAALAEAQVGVEAGDLRALAQ
jgi:hypothetical protein